MVLTEVEAKKLCDEIAERITTLTTSGNCDVVIVNAGCRAEMPLRINTLGLKKTDDGNFLVAIEGEPIADSDATAGAILDAILRRDKKRARDAERARP